MKKNELQVGDVVRLHGSLIKDPEGTYVDTVAVIMYLSDCSAVKYDPRFTYRSVSQANRIKEDNVILFTKDYIVYRIGHSLIDVDALISLIYRDR